MTRLTLPQRWALDVIANMPGVDSGTLRANGVDSGMVSRLEAAGVVFRQLNGRVDLTDQGLRESANEATAVHFDPRLGRYVRTHGRTRSDG